MTDNIAVFTKHGDKYVLVHIKNRITENIYVYDSLTGPFTGSIINCRVDRNLEGIGGSFVQFDKNETGYINRILKCADIIPLQYQKEAYDDKKARFTDKLTIGGDYVVVTKNATHVKASSKIPADKRQEITESFRREASLNNAGIIVRTKAYTEEDGINNAFNELHEILSSFDRIYEKAEHVPQYTVLYTPLPLYIRDILYLTEKGITNIITDDMDVMEALGKEYADVSGPVNITDRVGPRFYEDKLVSLGALYSLNGRISECCSRKVYLKSGAYITFDETEAFTSVDVNTSKASSKKKGDDSHLTVNIEAAVEIARQLRLRNISGMIIIDFINMDTADSYDELETCIKNEISADRESTRFVDFTGLKLAEIVRKRTGRSLIESLRSNG